MQKIFIVALVMATLVGCAEEKKPISTFEFFILSEDCKAKGGVPTPIYDKTDPTKVFGLPCYAKQ